MTSPEYVASSKLLTESVQFVPDLFGTFRTTHSGDIDRQSLSRLWFIVEDVLRVADAPDM